jgi:solute:Na+ symporter, SSS family
MFGMQIIDIVVIVLYFAWIIWIGYRSMKRIHNQEDFFLGGRRFGKLIAMFSMFGQATSGESGSGAATQVKQMGMSGIMVNIFPNFFALPVFFFSAKWMRRLRLLTMSLFYEDRYKSRKLAAVYTISQALFFILVVGISFMAMAKTIQAITPKPVEALTVEQRAEYDQAMRREVLEKQDYASLGEGARTELKELRLLKPHRHFSYFGKFGIVFGLAFVVLIYAIGGGLEAAAKTDVIQSIFTLLMTVLLLPVGLMRINTMYGSSGFIGAFRSIHRVLPESVFELMGSPANAEMTWYLMLAMALMLPNSLCQANQLVAAGAAKDDRTAREGFVDGLLIKRFATVIWGLVGMVILTIYAGELGDPDLLWGIASRDLLGSLGIGLVGLMAACLMAALMSLADTHMITVAGMLTESVYRPLVPDKSERHYVTVGRIFSGVYLVGGVAVAMLADDLWTFFKYMVTFNVIFAAPFLMGMIWRRANAKAAWATVIVTGTVTVLVPLVVSFTSLNESEILLKANTSQEIVRTYKASLNDVTERERDIKAWKESEANGNAVGACPVVLQEGVEFEKTFASRERAVFWDGITAEKQDDGALVRKGKGLIRAEMLILAGCGVPLEKLSYPMLETLRFMMKFLLSFVPFIVVALLTKPMDAVHLDPFYAKLRTPSYADREKDAEEMAKTIVDPHRFDSVKLFAGSSFELNRWDGYEVKGVIRIMVYVVLIYVALYAVTMIGA